MKRAGALPADLALKVSVQMGAANPIAVRWIGEQLGATTYNVPPPTYPCRTLPRSARP